MDGTNPEVIAVFRRTILLAAIFGLTTSSQVLAQEWAKKMFIDGTEHKFGVVARGAKAEFRFPIKNLYVEDVEIQSVRSSCGCTTPELTQTVLKTFETAELVAHFNTRSFTGEKDATITVTFSKPFFAAVQVHVSGYIRSDVVLNPGSVDLGSIEQGKPAEKTIDINYAGRSDWRVLDVQTANPKLSAALTETGRTSGQVSYKLSVKLADDAPVGYIKDQLILVTNDVRAKQIPVDVEGRVAAEVSISPASLFMGVLQPGQKATKQLVIRAKKEFRVKSVTCEDGSFTFQTNNDSKQLHVIPVTFTAGDTPGKISQKLVIETDLGDVAIPECVVHAQVVEKK
jgi:hypothetical protein